jgi:hypothetical protein
MMANTYVWTVTSMDAYPTNPQPDCVFNVNWECVATSDQTHVVDGQTLPYIAKIYSTQFIVYNANEQYIPYANLTQTEVLSWIYENGVDQTATQNSLDNMIANQINPTVVTPALPWNA